MDLATHIQTRGNSAKLAKATGLSQPFISQLAGGHRTCSEETAAAIDNATQGVVPAESLRPDVTWLRRRGRVTGYRVAIPAAA